MALDQLSWWEGGGGESVTLNLTILYILVLLVFVNRGVYSQTFLFFCPTSKVFTSSNAINAFKQ